MTPTIKRMTNKMTRMLARSSTSSSYFGLTSSTIIASSSNYISGISIFVAQLRPCESSLSLGQYSKAIYSKSSNVTFFARLKTNFRVKFVSAGTSTRLNLQWQLAHFISRGLSSKFTEMSSKRVMLSCNLTESFVRLVKPWLETQMSTSRINS